jgi:hypothetical protein
MRTKHDYEDKAFGPARSGMAPPAPERTPAAPGVLPERPDAEYLIDRPETVARVRVVRVGSFPGMLLADAQEIRRIINDHLLAGLS